MVLSPNAPHPFRPLRLPRLQFDRSLAIALALSLHLAFGLWMAMPVSVAPDPSAPVSPVEPQERIIVEPVKARVVENLPPPPPLAPPLRRVETPPAVEPQPTPVVIDTPAEWSLPAPETTPVAEYVSETARVAAPAESGVPLAYGVASPPPYPRDAARLGHEGTVMLKVLVDESGAILQVGVEQSSGHRSLDQAALRHVKREWRFRPAMVDGRAVRAWAIVPIEFSLL